MAVRPRGPERPARRRARALLAALALLGGVALAPGPAPAVLIVTGDGTGNTAPPPDDPGFGYVGSVGLLTGVYVGNGWVLTANHVGEGDLVLGGATYPVVAGSTVRLRNPDASVTDLRVFRIQGAPDWPPLPIASSGRAPGENVVMVGNGRKRLDPVTWNPPGPISTSGWSYGGSRTIRWGRNLVSDPALTVDLGSQTVESFATTFDDPAGPDAVADECQAVVGDSGGAVFAMGPGGWELAGILFSIETWDTQPSQTALFGNRSFAADLSVYRDQIIALVRPECSNEVDDDGDGLVDWPEDPGCHSATGLSELPDCADGLDNDGDGWVDWAEDPGCWDGADASMESPACQDGVDNDGDGLVDFDGGASLGLSPPTAPDPECSDKPFRNRETSGGCGLGFEWVAAMPLWALGRRRRASRSAAAR